jgi:hypothetical protein
LASEIDVDDRSLDPVMITGTRGTFLESRVARGGYLRFGFSECPMDLEGALLLEFYKQLVKLATEKKWSCVAESPESAVAVMKANGETPFHLVAGPWVEADDIEGARVLDIGFPRGAALLVASPARAGLHTRIGAHVGVLAYRINRAFVAVVQP